jgi:hypothetical protein
VTQPASAALLSDGTRLGRLAMAAAAVALGLVALTGVLGPSAAVVPLPPGPFPLGASLHPSAWPVTLHLAAAVGLSVIATATGWAALRKGWAPSPPRLLAAGIVAAGLLAAVPPVGGADVLSYAAYGHIADQGRDPYAVRPSSLTDPFTRAVEDPWRSTPSVYGPLATAEQALVVQLSGGDLRLAVGLLDVVNAAAFAAAGWLLFLLAGGDDDRRRRAALAFGGNPVLLFAVVAGGHLDALAVVAVVGALALLASRPKAETSRGEEGPGPPWGPAWWAGVVAGAGVLVKLTAGLPVAGWAWLLERSGRRRQAVAVVAGAVAATTAGYLGTGLHALAQARRASSFVSVGTPWRPIRSVLQAIAGHGVAGAIVAAGSLALAVLLAVRLARGLPEVDPGDRVGEAARAGLVVALAWTLAAPYVLAWYDAVPWALAALQPVSRYHRILLAHTGMLALAYLPGRVVALPPGLGGTAAVLRSAVSPLVLGVLLIVAFTGSPQRPVGTWGRPSRRR